MLRAATPADFGFIRGLAQRPDYAPFITDEDEAALSAYLASPAARLLIWQGPEGTADGEAEGYALFCGLGTPSGVVELRRLALARPGQGRGAGFVAALVDHGFEVLGAGRLWLDASGENPRAMTLYERAGFRREGVLRRHWWRPDPGAEGGGRLVDQHLFGLMREEWATRRAA
ncbi:GNAT family N-acetyltransferase [Pseudogemmobacter sonorensis]|uniref:GNAT family N-acetyltransferase n=1 Tax=Pseudogemmobacter sonorensis TaxID=2989681 RepID=UPI00368372E6